MKMIIDDSTTIEYNEDGIIINTSKPVSFKSNSEPIASDSKREGLKVVDSTNPNRAVFISNGVIAFTEDGGKTYSNAISPDGTYVEKLHGKLFLGEHITIDDPNGVWVTENAKATIADRCRRKVMKLGFYDKSPDKFGIKLNRYPK